MIVHACHCRCCQRETSSTHALNAVYEAERVVHTGTEPEIVDTPSARRQGAAKCKVAIWSNYCQSGAMSRFVRVGTLDEPDRLPPDIHIYTSSKQPWVTLPRQVRRPSPSSTILLVFGRPSRLRRAAPSSSMGPASVRV